MEVFCVIIIIIIIITLSFGVGRLNVVFFAWLAFVVFGCFLAEEILKMIKTREKTINGPDNDNEPKRWDFYYNKNDVFIYGSFGILTALCLL